MTTIGLIIILGITAAAYFATITSEPDLKPDINPDSSTYLVLAKSLSSGHGYKNIDLDCSPSHTHFPIVFPALLMPFVFFFGFNVLILKAFITLLACIAFLCLAIIFIRNKIGCTVPVLLLTMVSPWIFQFSHSIMSEIPYLLFSLSAVFFALRFIEEKRCLNLNGMLTVFFLALACFTRSIGISLTVATVCALLFDLEHNRASTRYKKAAFIIMGVVLFALAYRFMSQNNPHAAGGSYVNELFIDPYDHTTGQMNFSNLMVRLLHNSYALVFYGLPNMLAGTHFKGRNALSIVLAGFTAWGLITAFKKNRSIIEWYLVCYLLILLIWPWTRNHGTRFLIPMVPFVFYYFLTGIIAFKKTIPLKRLGSALYAVVFTMLLAANVLFCCRFAIAEYGKDWKESPSGKYIKMADFINEISPADAAFISGNSSALYVWGRRKSPCVDITTVDGFGEAVKNNRGGYLVTDPASDPESFQAVIGRHPEWFSELYNSDGLKVYKLR